MPGSRLPSNRCAAALLLAIIAASCSISSALIIPSPLPAAAAAHQQRQLLQQNINSSADPASPPPAASPRPRRTPRPKPTRVPPASPPAPPPVPAEQPRLDIAEIDAMPNNNPYKVLMLLAWSELTTSRDTESPLSFWALAGIHGLSSSYDGMRPPSSSGFCRHAQPDFGPWHRPFMATFEQGLQAAARTAAAKFATKQLQDQYSYVAKQIRLPYLDWTSGSVPGILTASTVTVLNAQGNPVSIANPFGSYRYPANPGGSRGSSTSRSYSWSSTMARAASTNANSANAFVRSYNWGCTYTGSSRCSGDLEGIHNNIHNIIGGSSGEMATVKWAGFDPLFWLHHCQIDRLLWLFQNNGGLWQGSKTYLPFTALGGDASNLKSYNYSYRDPYTLKSSSFGRRRQLLQADPQALPSQLALPGLDAGSEVGSPAAVAAVSRALAAWGSGDAPAGYSWQLQLLELDRNQLGTAVHIFVFLNRSDTTQADTQQPWRDQRRYRSFNALRARSNFCGSVSGFNDLIDHLDGKTVAASVDLTACLRAAGLDPGAAAASADAANPAAGPAACPVKVSDLRLLALTARGVDVSSRFVVGRTAISWSLPTVMTAQQAAAATMATAAEGDAAVAAAAALPSPAATVFTQLTGLFE